MTTPFLKVNFQAQTTSTPTGYQPDYGQSFNSTAGYGWENASTGAALSLVGNGRERGVASDKRLDTFVHMQLPSGADGVSTPGKWEATVPNGTYTVTIGVGDPSNTDSHDVLNAEGIKIIDFTPTSATPQTTVTATVVVTDGRLTIDPNGGTNTKIDYIDIASGGSPDTTAPTVTITPSGTQDGSGNYQNSATVTLAGSDASGVKSMYYSVDGGTSIAYTTPFQVTTAGSHTIKAVGIDNANNVSTAVSRTFNVTSTAAGVHVNFQAQTTTTPTGYQGDYGQSFTTTRGYGWENASTGAALSLVGNGRERGVASDKRLDTFVHMQLPSGADGVSTPGKWEATVPNGTYTVTIGVGDPTNTDSHDVLNAEGTKIVDFTPSVAHPQTTVTANVTVSDGRLTIDPNGGTNTKIDYIDVVPNTGGATGDTTAPTTFVNTTGSVDSSGNYLLAASATMAASDAVGVTSKSYSIDGGTSQTYTGPFTVSTVGVHSIVVSASDAAGNVSLPVGKTIKIVPLGQPLSSAASYDPFGVRCNLSGSMPSIGFQGSWTDLASSAQRVNAQSRWYSPALGSFASRDWTNVPINSGTDVNRFTYGGDNPLTNSDPTGQFWGGSELSSGLHDVAKVGEGAAKAGEEIASVGETVGEAGVGITEAIAAAPEAVIAGGIVLVWSDPAGEPSLNQPQTQPPNGGPPTSGTGTGTGGGSGSGSGGGSGRGSGGGPKTKPASPTPRPPQPTPPTPPLPTPPAPPNGAAQVIQAVAEIAATQQQFQIPDANTSATHS